MKKIIFSLLALLIVQTLQSQAPEKFNYQAVVRNDLGEVIQNQPVNFRISILEGSADGRQVYSETHNLSTNALGMVDMVIGEGSAPDGSMSNINWGGNAHFLMVEVDPDGSGAFRSMGTSQLISVPYALYSGAVNQPLNKVTVVADANHAIDDALFEVRDQKGNTLFAVYPEGTRVYIDDSGVKGPKGGFAVGGYKNTKQETNEYFRITPDSIRIYIEEPLGKALKGGFAIGGYKNAKDVNSALLYGEFGPKMVRINDKLGIGRTPVDYTFEVEGDAYKTDPTTWDVASDSRIKTDINDIENAIEQVMKLRPVTFRYSDYWRSVHPGIKDEVYYNFVAQEFREVFPESVEESSEPFKDEEQNVFKMNNQPALIVAIKAVQDLVEENRRQQQLIEELQQENLEMEDLKSRIEQLEKLLVPAE